MANGINNKYEYRSGLLDSLNVQHTASDVRNEDEYRKKVLNGLGVEYTEDDINQKNLYRAKVVEGLASSGGGGESNFSTAEVTIVNNDEVVRDFYLPIIDNINEPHASFGIIQVQQGGDTNATAILYENLCACSILGGGTVTVTGNAALISSSLVAISGDCTITIS